MSMIEVRGLSKSFGDLQVLQNVNLMVEEGERIAIIGESGCGKSLLLRCLELLEIPDTGFIAINGQEITAAGADVDKIRQSMGMVYQKFYLFSHLTVMENLCLAPMKLRGLSRGEAETKALHLLSRVGLTTKAEAYPEVLSGGQQQRIAICRSLMMDPKVLLFDEPTSALDPTMVGEVLAVMRLLAKRKLTMLVVTHEMNFAREFANRVLFLADKGIYEAGTPQEIFDNPQKEKTIAFVQKHKYFHYEINDRAFDLMEMQGGIWGFAEKYGIDGKNSRRLQLCCEETIYELISECYAPLEPVRLTVNITYNETDGSIKAAFTSGGRPYNPFAADRGALEDDAPYIGAMIICNITDLLGYEYEQGENRLRVQLKIL